MRPLRVESDIKSKLKELRGDDRMKYKPALVQINAPLALIQTSIAGKIAALEWVLKERANLICG